MGGRGSAYGMTDIKSESIGAIRGVNNFKAAKYLTAGATGGNAGKAYQQGYTFEYSGYKFGIAKKFGQYQITDLNSGALIGIGKTQKDAMKPLTSGKYEQLIKTDRYKTAVNNFKSRRRK